MNLRLFCAGTLGCVILAGIHGCSSDDDSAPDQSSGAASGAGGTRASGGRGGSAGTRASGGTSGNGATSNAGAASGTSGREGAGGVAESGGARGSGGTRTTSGGNGGDLGGKGGVRSGTGGDELGGGGAGGESGEAGAETGGAPWSGGAGAGAEAGLGGAAGDHGEQPCVDTLNLPLLTSAPETLDQTGLYTSASADPTDTAPYADEYTPTYPLWSDGANKKRWMYLPACTQIDTSDMNHWVFPVGTRFWKEFRVGDTLVETRFIHRYGPGPDDWLFAAYQWDPDVPSPTAGNTSYVPHGVNNANGTQHDIPDQSACPECHAHLPEHILGFSAFELTGSPGAIDIGVLGNQHLLSVPAPNGFTPPGTSTQQAGLGYLHANCGICHNAFFHATTTSPPQMRLLVEQTTLDATDTYTTMVNVLTQNPDFPDTYRIKPGDHANSEVYMRMSTRVNDQMPPIATEVVDTDGVATVAAFIDSLPP